ncbi:type II toxin-antitoxin system RelE/ParE family toxin [Brevundimonas diminuta]|uniref:type II toxin-antitoxin system RelE/ParE family toxin n=1 Tax=Brevundimonas diminuta TaxID=293 RepID=UPI0028ACCEAD|nr:type II toxin-antitoxin system RelE/ParE family toxin [Brevundimonas diminuta]
MNRAVDWSRDALNDLGEQIAYIAQDNPAAARRVADQIRDTGRSLGEMATGRPGRVAGVYEKPVPRLPYILAYEITVRGAEERLTIVRVIHTARDWPRAGWPK